MTKKVLLTSKKPLFIFFDFECSQDTGVHIPNYCIAHRACDLCIDKPLEFHFLHVANSKKEEKLFSKVRKH